MRTRKPISRFHLAIKRRDRVLEVGPGNNPVYRSNVLAERFLHDDYHRAGHIAVYPHQQLIQTDGESLPFKDKEFDYVICNQVLEHVDHPDLLLNELMRVAKRGYLETPSLLGEFLAPKAAHRWAILDIDNKLVLYEKSKMAGNFGNDYGELFLNYLPYQSLPFKVLKNLESGIMLNGFEWKDSFEYIINPEDEYYQSFFTKKWTRAMVETLEYLTLPAQKVRKYHPPNQQQHDTKKV